SGEMNVRRQKNLGARAVLGRWRALRASDAPRPRRPGRRLSAPASFRSCASVSLVLASAVVVLAPGVVLSARLKDIATIEGVRPNQLSGYGLVAGLNGSGDSQQSVFTPQSVINLLKRRGIVLNVNPRQLQVKNVAAVMVTATLPPFARQGTR